MLMLHVHHSFDMISRSCAILCFIAGISIASGSWYDEEDWGLKHPERTTFLCPSDLPITSVYSQFNRNTSQREWKFSCQWNGIKNLSIATSWSERANVFQEDFSFTCPRFDGSHFIFGVDVLYNPNLADGRWRFGCGRVQPGYRLANCTTIPTLLSIGKLQQAFEYTATDNTTFVTGFASEYDDGLKDRLWGLTYCKLATVQCDKPPQPEGVAVTYHSLQYGSTIKYKCQANYTYVPERTGLCDNSGLWTASPPHCQPCAEIPYCQKVLCIAYDLTAVICAECQNFTSDGLKLTRNQHFECEADPVITNSLPKLITFDDYDLVTLNCNASGYPKPKVVWFHNSSVVSKNDRVLLLSNGSLVILQAEMSDAGFYMCRASSNGHNVSISVTLKQKKLEPPIIVDWTNTLYFPLRQSAELHCTAIGHPQPNIIWQKDGVLLQHKGRIRILSNGTLFIKRVKERDSGRYRCTARNRIDWIAREALVHVYRKVDTQIPEDPGELFAPIIKPWNLLIAAFLNGQVVLTCNSFGNPKPVIKWLKATRYGDKVLRQDSKISIHSNGSLVINNVDYHDKGQYSCRASNSVGTVEKHLLVMVKSSTSTPTTAVTTTSISTTKKAVTATSLSTSTSETLTVPTNSTMPVIDPHPPTADSHASTLKINWLLICIFSAYKVLSLL